MRLLFKNKKQIADKAMRLFTLAQIN